MPRKEIICLILLSLLLCTSLYCTVGQSSGAVLNELPGLGETLTIDSDSTLTINEGETVECAGELKIQSGVTPIPTFEIINYGNLKFSNAIQCNAAHFNVKNYGTLTFEDASLQLNGFANVTVQNQNSLTMQDVNIQVYTGYMYIQNNGTLDAQNLYIKDQNDGTWISNYGDASFSESTFVANGASGKIEIFSSGVLEIYHGVFDGNYGGTINVNTATGSLTMTDSGIDVSGSSHGKNSEVNIIAADAMWENCHIQNNAAKINYLNTGQLGLFNCSINNEGTSASTILSNNGGMVFEDGSISGSGTISITSWRSSQLIDCTFSSSKSLTLINNDGLTVENWQVKTTDSNANINILNSENGTINFDESFIQDVSVDTLNAIGPEGQQFTEASGGTITVTNNGTITQSMLHGTQGLSLTYILAIIVAIIFIIIVIFFVRKRNAESKEQK
jgi:hypothetical protein